MDLILYLRDKGFQVEAYDLKGQWAEFNSPADIAHFILGTKAETLERLEPIVKKSFIGKQVSFSCKEWHGSHEKVVAEIQGVFGKAKLVVRSSSKGEDNWSSSNAGGYESLLDVSCEDSQQLMNSVNKVIGSYGHQLGIQDQVLVQEFLSDVQMSGVVFTCSLDSGLPYYQFNFDDQSALTDSVTSGAHNDLRTIVLSKFDKKALKSVEPRLVPVLDAVVELEELLGFDKLDIEFAVCKNGVVNIFQVRPITVNHSVYEFEDSLVKRELENAQVDFINSQKGSPFILGDEAIFANMPDWNPAEIIGNRPKPLSYSLYSFLITDEIWAKQRYEYGYRDVRPFPLLRSLCGQPYVDVRASFNSFIPAGLSEEVTSRVVNAYLSILARKPFLHDKVEFEIAFTIWNLGFKEKAKKRLGEFGVLDSDIEVLEASLKKITSDALTRLDKDSLSLSSLQTRREETLKSNINHLGKIYILLNDCKRLGTIAFAHAARAGFVAITILKDFVENDIFDENRLEEFMQSFNTVAGNIEQDRRKYNCGKLDLNDLIEKYGHLRPGTYEVSSKAYWESPETYLLSDNESSPDTNESVFGLTKVEFENIKEYLNALKSDISPYELIDFMKLAIQSRESSKLEFTKNLSLSFDLLIEYGESVGLHREDLSYLTHTDIDQLFVGSLSVEKLKELVVERKHSYLLRSSFEMPAIIRDIHDFHCFERLTLQPNFITSKAVEGVIELVEGGNEQDLSGKIVLISQADPGYDWLFGQGVLGLVTKYGGANSHMAIRSAELNLPSVIGVGDKMFDKLKRVERVKIDCSNKVIRVIV